MTENFNRILRRFRDDLSTADYQSKMQVVARCADRLERFGVHTRQDFGRDWENAHVLREIDRLAATGAENVLDVGGGNSPFCYVLAESRLHVTVLDVDPAVVARVARGADALGVADRLRAAVNENAKPWPIEDDAFDVAVSISVFEGILRSRRAHYWSELRRVLRPGGTLLMTFDYGAGGRLVGDPPVSPEEVEDQILGASGMTLVGAPLDVPEFDPDVGPPVKAVVPTVDGFDFQVAEYSFGAVHLRNGYA